MFGLFSKKNKEDLDKGLDKTKQSVLSRIGRIITGKSRVDQDMLDQLEMIVAQHHEMTPVPGAVVVVRIHRVQVPTECVGDERQREQQHQDATFHAENTSKIR